MLPACACGEPDLVALVLYGYDEPRALPQQQIGTVKVLLGFADRFGIGVGLDLNRPPLTVEIQNLVQMINGHRCSRQAPVERSAKSYTCVACKLRNKRCDGRSSVQTAEAR
jgi:hypothetical protein